MCHGGPGDHDAAGEPDGGDGRLGHFTAAASGTPAPTYQWQLNGANISGATSASYIIASVATGNAGTYTMVATTPPARPRAAARC